MSTSVHLIIPSMLWSTSFDKCFLPPSQNYSMAASAISPVLWPQMPRLLLLFCINPPVPWSHRHPTLVEDCNCFLQCSLALEMHPFRFPTERCKIAYMAYPIWLFVLHYSQWILWTVSLTSFHHRAQVLLYPLTRNSLLWWLWLIQAPLGTKFFRMLCYKVPPLMSSSVNPGSCNTLQWFPGHQGNKPPNLHLTNHETAPLICQKLLRPEAMSIPSHQVSTKTRIHPSIYFPCCFKFIFFVAKKDRGLWPCIDYRALNSVRWTWDCFNRNLVEWLHF